jgi:hypothetical protein
MIDVVYYIIRPGPKIAVLECLYIPKQLHLVLCDW